MNYLTAEDIIKINVMVIGRYSPKEPADLNSLQMIVEPPKQEILGKVLYPDIYSKAAIIWVNLIKKHPFYNANQNHQCELVVCSAAVSRSYRPGPKAH